MENEDQCKEKEQCAQLLQLVLDGEASPDQEDFFFKHIDDCVYCLNGYEFEKSLRKIIKSKIKKQAVPADLVEAIKLKISHTA